MQKPNWEDRYSTGNTPWDTGVPDEHLIDIVKNLPIRPCRVLEIGCGTGTNALWMAEQGFGVLGIDLSPLAINAAKAKANEVAATGHHEGSCEFRQLDFLSAPPPDGPYDFVFDRGCFHVFDKADEQSEYAKRVAAVLGPQGQWLSIIGSTEGGPREEGPPRRTLRDVVNAIEPFLELCEMRSVVFRAHAPTKALAWRCLSRQRQVPAQPSTLRQENEVAQGAA